MSARRHTCRAKEQSSYSRPGMQHILCSLWLGSIVPGHWASALFYSSASSLLRRSESLSPSYVQCSGPVAR